MTTESTPAKVRLIDQLGHASEAQPLLGRLRTDVLWHQRRGNETIAQDCQEAADGIEAERESRGMFVARLENMQQNGNHWLTVAAVLALLNDCDMLASSHGFHARPGRGSP